jgi:hypothetical protein
MIKNLFAGSGGLLRVERLGRLFAVFVLSGCTKASSMIDASMRVLMKRQMEGKTHMEMAPKINPPLRTLLGPGPSPVNPRVLQSLSLPVIGHLDPAFLKFMD